MAMESGHLVWLKEEAVMFWLVGCCGFFCGIAAEDPYAKPQSEQTWTILTSQTCR